MRTDLQLAENCQLVGNHNLQSGDSIVSVDEFVEDGIRYLTFATLSAEDFAKSYTLLHAFGDILHRPCNRDSFANPNFLADYTAIKKAVMTICNRDRAMPIVLTGHGIGGSLALIAGYDLVKKGYTVNRVTTFGALRALYSKKAIPLVAYPLKLVTLQYVLPGDKYPNMFKFTGFKNINSSVLESGSESGSSIDAYIDALEVMA